MKAVLHSFSKNHLLPASLVSAVPDVSWIFVCDGLSTINQKR